jgi:hypothetical protein
VGRDDNVLDMVAQYFPGNLQKNSRLQQEQASLFVNLPELLAPTKN